MFKQASLMENYYQILGLSIHASPRKIRDQYRKLAKIYHPDKTSDPAEKAHYAEKFKEINEAYEALSDVVRRANLGPKERKLDFLYRRGKKLFDQKKWTQAMIVFNEVLAIDSAYQDTLVCLQEARRKHKHLAARYSQANTLFQQKKWSEAMQVLELILLEDPGYRDAAKKFKQARRQQLMVDFINQY